MHCVPFFLLTEVVLPLTFASVVYLRHFCTKTWSGKGLSVVLKRFEKVMFIDVKYWLLYFVSRSEPEGGMRRRFAYLKEHHP